MKTLALIRKVFGEKSMNYKPESPNSQRPKNAKQVKRKSAASMHAVMGIALQFDFISFIQHSIDPIGSTFSCGCGNCLNSNNRTAWSVLGLSNLFFLSTNS
jgi:hypothetical protein